MLGEIQTLVKALLGYGARMPKELMLFVKNMVFLDGAIASLAPDLDLFAEIANISMYFAETHGERIAADVGIDPDVVRVRLHRHQGLVRRRPRRHRAPDLPRPAGAPRDHPRAHAGQAQAPPPLTRRSHRCRRRARRRAGRAAGAHAVSWPRSSSLLAVRGRRRASAAARPPAPTSIEPLPDGMSVVADAVDGCREGESGLRLPLRGGRAGRHRAAPAPCARHLRDEASSARLVDRRTTAGPPTTCRGPRSASSTGLPAAGRGRPARPLPRRPGAPHRPAGRLDPPGGPRRRRATT